MNSPSPSGGGVSVKSSLSAAKAKSKSSSLKESTGASNIHPLIDMSKLLQSQSPGVAPNIVAQSTMPPAAAAAAASTSSALPKQSLSSSSSPLVGAQPPGQLPKVLPKPVLGVAPGPLPSQVRPVQLSKGSNSLAGLASATPLQQGIQTVNKKTLNTVLDRLSGLNKHAPPPMSSSSGSTPGSSSSSPSPSSSNLLNQLQAPTLASKAKPPTPK